MAVQSGQPEREIGFSSDTLVTIAVEPPARLVFRAAGCWIAPVDVANGTSRVESRAWPAASLRGKVIVPAGEKLPASINLRVSLEGKSETTDCALAAGALRCSIPSAPIDVRIAPADATYAPLYARGLSPRPGQELDLGDIKFRRGASLVGSIDLRGLTLPADKLLVELRPEVFETSDARWKHDAIPVHPSRDGFFQFTGIPSGTYEVRASAPHRSPARLRSIAITEAREYVVDSLLRLDPLVPLRVMITPPVDGSQRPWTVLLERSEARSMILEQVSRAPADLTGWWDGEPVPSGTYVLSVIDAVGSKVHSQRLEITPPASTIEVRLELVPVRGSVRAGARPFPSRLDFYRTGGAVTIQTDDDGKFTGMLPREGKWNVRVMSPGSTKRFYILKLDIDVRRRADATTAVIDLTLPGGRIRGTVVDDKGNPAGADIGVYRFGELEANSATDADGTFELLGVEPGPVSLRAMARGAESGLVLFDASEVIETEAHLVVRKVRTLKGWLTTSDSQPIAGALLRYVSPSLIGIEQTTTGPSGDFKLKIPASTTSVTLATLVPGLPIHVQTLDVSDDRNAHLIVGRASGRFFVRMSKLSKRMPTPFLIAPGSMPMPVTALLFPPDGSGRLPRGLESDGFAFELEPGTYRLCNRGMSTCLQADIRAGAETTIEGESLR